MRKIVSIKMIIFVFLLLCCGSYVYYMQNQISYFTIKINELENSFSNQNKNVSDDKIRELEESLHILDNDISKYIHLIKKLEKNIYINEFFINNPEAEKVSVILKNIYKENDSVILEYDVCEFLTGEAAQRSYKQDNNIMDENEIKLGSGFYLRNVEELTESTQLSHEPLIIMLFLSEEEYKEASVEELVNQFKKGDAFYNFYFIENKVGFIEEFYIP